MTIVLIRMAPKGVGVKRPDTMDFFCSLWLCKRTGIPGYGQEPITILLIILLTESMVDFIGQ